MGLEHDKSIEKLYDNIVDRLEKLEKTVNEMRRKAMKILDDLFYPSYYGYYDEHIKIYRDEANGMIIEIDGHRIRYYEDGGSWHVSGDWEVILEHEDELRRIGTAILNCENEARHIRDLLHRANRLDKHYPGIYDKTLEEINKILETPIWVSD